MRILWITNTIFPAPSKALGFSTPVMGGWMYSLASRIAKSDHIDLAVATVYSGDEIKICRIDGIIYYLLPAKSKIVYQKKLEQIWRKVCDEFDPDIVHIYGTEFAHGLACMRACPSRKYIISIQGLVSVISEYYYSGISFLDIIKNLTFRDIVKFDTLFDSKRKFAKRGKLELEYLNLTEDVDGRTSWDYAHVKSINPRISYYHCDRLLRSGFYASSKWDISTKKKFSIFCSQSSYPIKGLHQVIKAVALLVRDFPDIEIRIAGYDITRSDTLVAKIKLSGYGLYLKRLIDRCGLVNNVSFTGPLSEEQMIKEYKNAHVFICSSSIENSPNSVAEAQILGTPVIASYVGGTPDMIVDGESGLLYRFEEFEMLSEKIREIFTDNDLAKYLSKNEICTAEERHNREINLDRMLKIYSEIGEK